MKVLFVKDVEPTAIAGEVAEVKNGFARNYLMPRGLAVLATQAVIDRSEELMRKATERREAAKRDWVEVGEKLSQSEIKLEALSSPTGKLYGSVSRSAIAAEIKKAVDRDILAKNIRANPPIKTCGTHKVLVNLPEEVSVEIKVSVTASAESATVESEPEAPESEQETTPEETPEADSEEAASDTSAEDSSAQ